MNLAAALLASHRDRFAAEAMVVDLLYQVLPGWHLLFPTRRSWLWTPRDVIDVWNVNENDAAVRALFAAGFVGGVTIHGHRPERFLSCTCKQHRPER